MRWMDDGWMEEEGGCEDEDGRYRSIDRSDVGIGCPPNLTRDSLSTHTTRTTQNTTTTLHTPPQVSHS